MKIDKQKLYVVRKFVMANSAKDALGKERKQCPDEIWLDEAWKASLIPQPQQDKNVGFKGK